MISNKDVADQLYELANLTSKYGKDYNDRFRIGAYERAAAFIESCGLPLHKMSKSEMVQIKGIGKNVAEKIYNVFHSGSIIPKLAELRLKELSSSTSDEIETLKPVCAVLSVHSKKVQFLKIKNEYVFIVDQSEQFRENTTNMLRGISWDIEGGVTSTTKVHRRCVNIQYWVYFKS